MRDVNDLNKGTITDLTNAKAAKDTEINAVAGL